jgi:2-methylcitrate dehydratase PrpD
MNELRKLAEYVADLRLEDIPKEAVSAAKFCTLDSIGAAVGAAHNEEIREAVKEILAFAGENLEHSSSIWGQKRKTSVFQAVLLNGLMGNALDIDDVHTGSRTHIGSVVLPAAWSLAEAMGATCKELLEAVIAGYEVMARVGKGFGINSHRSRGWHATGTAGTFGAAAACAKLLKLDKEKTLSAFGMAGTQSSGLWAFLEDGSSSKLLHPARAAANGLTAAFMAKAGMTGPEHILDAKDGGLYKATSDSYSLQAVSSALGEKYEIMHIDVRPYPCSRSTHCTIDAALKIRISAKVSVADIQSIIVETYEAAVKLCGSSKYPEKAVEAKFSIPYCVAAALVDGEVGLEQFTSEKISDAAIKNIAEKVKVSASEEFTQSYPARLSCSLTINLKDGTSIIEKISDASGSVKNPLSLEQAKEKFILLTSSILGKENSTILMNAILDAENIGEIPAL